MRTIALAVLELSGLSAIVAGISMVYVPAGLVAAGLIAVLAALALESRKAPEAS